MKSRALKYPEYMLTRPRMVYARACARACERQGRLVDALLCALPYRDVWCWAQGLATRCEQKLQRRNT
jgi:hypothetical protein